MSAKYFFNKGTFYIDVKEGHGGTNALTKYQKMIINVNDQCVVLSKIGESMILGWTVAWLKVLTN